MFILHHLQRPVRRFKLQSQFLKPFKNNQTHRQQETTSQHIAVEVCFSSVGISTFKKFAFRVANADVQTPLNVCEALDMLSPDLGLEQFVCLGFFFVFVLFCFWFFFRDILQILYTDVTVYVQFWNGPNLKNR